MAPPAARPARPALAGLLVGLVCLGYLLVWQLVVEGCTADGFGCIGPGLLMVYGGVPVTVVLVALAFRLAGTRRPWVATGVLLLALLALQQWGQWLLSALDVPAPVWPVLLGVLAFGWARLGDAPREERAPR